MSKLAMCFALILGALMTSPVLAAPNNYPPNGMTVTTDINGDYHSSAPVTDPSRAGQYVKSIPGHYTPHGPVADPSAKPLH